MSNIARFAAYAAQFEKAYVNDDWSSIEPYFTEDAVYDAELPAPLGGRFEGRPAILGYFKYVLDQFDRRFETREVALLDGPREEGDSVWIRGSASYTAEGVPDLTFELEETVTFDGDRISRLHDSYDAAVLAQLIGYLEQHGPRIGIDLGNRTG